MVNRVLRNCISLFVFLIIASQALSQRYLGDLDSSLFIKDTLRPFLKRFENLRFTGYIQPQFQQAESKGTKTFAGNDFSQFAASRFMLRRARVRLDYLITDSKNRWAKALFTFQVDATERGVNVRDMFVRVYDNKYHLFSLTAGLVARPYGFEVNLSSAFRETPERARISQTLMPSERDLGVMVSFDPQDRKRKLGNIKFDVGLFNGPGLSGTADFDSHKDLISRLTIRPIRVKRFEFSGGLSLLYGGWRQGTKYEYDAVKGVDGMGQYVIDSSSDNLGKIAPRHYYGADMQVKLNHAWGATELRAEYWMGKQPGTATTSVNPGTLPLVPVYIRPFNGGIFCFLQNIVNTKHQLLLKYDWYDPATKVKDAEIGAPGSNTSVADLAFTTLGAGYVYYWNDHVKVLAYYDIVTNKSTLLSGYEKDIKDNVFTLRLQFRF